MTENTIEALRIQQVGLEAVAAQGTLTMDTQPTAEDTVVVGGVTYTWKASGAVSGEINVGLDNAAAQANFVAAVNGTDGIQDGANPSVSAAAFVADDCVLTARIPGPAGNSIATTETFSAGTNVFDAATLGTTTAGAHARGTPVVATTRLAVEQLEWGDDDETIYRPKVANGLLMRNRGRGAAVQHGTRFSLPDQAAIWEQLPLWLAMVVSGAPVVTGPLGGPYVFTYTSDPTENPSPLAATLQRRFTNGLGNDIDERAAYALLSSFGLSFAANEHLRLNGAGFARAFASSAITSGLTLPDFEVLVSALSTVYIDDTWATVGDTLLAEQVIGWRWTMSPGVFPRPTAEGRTTLDFTKHQVNGENRTLGLELTCLLDPTTYAAEQTKANTAATRAVRVRVTGSDGRQLDIDMLMQHAKPGLWAPGVDEGQDTVTFTLEEATDFTNFLAVGLTLPETFDIA